MPTGKTAHIVTGLSVLLALVGSAFDVLASDADDPSWLHDAQTVPALMDIGVGEVDTLWLGQADAAAAIHLSTGGELLLTDAHPVFVVGQGWRNAAALEPGDRLVSASGVWVDVVAVEHRPGSYDVWNLEVPDGQSFFVGDDGVWVHNGCGGASKGADDAVDAFRAVSKAEADDIAKHGFRPHPGGRSMEDKWSSETREGAEWFRNNMSGLDDVVQTKVPRSVCDRSYKHPNIDGTGPGFCVQCADLPLLPKP